MHVDTKSKEADGAQLFAMLYSQLREMAQSALRRSGPRLTLSPTTLLHDAYIDLSSRDPLLFPDRARFMAYASRAMRGLIVDYIRDARAQKRGSAFEITSLPTEVEPADLDGDQVTLGRLSDAMDELSSLEPALAELVDLKFFCGFSLVEIADMRDTSERTVQRDWQKARLLLYRFMQQGHR
jgi:RNA polymerase sigma factor (TIGR02999 family)